jgi:spermidine/putrescine transport system permease protein
VRKAYLGLILLFLYMPIAVLMALSFNASRSRNIWGGFSLHWYAELFNDPTIMRALYNTIAIAALAAAISTVAGTISAVGLHSMGKINKRVWLSVNNLPVFNPDIVTGVSLMVLFISAFRIFGVGTLGFGTLLIAHIVFDIPYVILAVLPKLRQMDQNLYEAALDLGATPRQAFLKVILPEISPGIITGAMLSFTMSIDDFVISFFTTGSGVNNISTIVYSMARRGINPMINALSTLMFIVVIILLFIINKRDIDLRKGAVAR